MKWFFYVVGLLCLVASMGSCAFATNRIEQTSGAVVGVIAILALGTGAILERLDALEQTIRQQAYEIGQVLSKVLFPPAR